MGLEFSPSDGATTLVVVFHGFGGSLRRLAGVREAIQQHVPNSDVLMPILWRGWLSNNDPVAITIRAIAMIDRVLQVRDYQRILLVGYSGGGLIARKLVIYVNGENADAPFEDAAHGLRGGRPWASRIERVVLLAGMNRGWSFAPTMNIFVTWMLQLLYYSFRASGLAGLFAALRRGEPFVTDLRIQWLSLIRSRKATVAVVQLLGTIDDIVSPDDNVDLQSGRDFLYLDVPGSGHGSVLDFTDEKYGGARRDAFVAALTDGLDVLTEKGLRLLGGSEDSVDETVDHVLFVIHGIRDYGFWTAHVARHVVSVALKQQKRIMPLTPTYGYFAMLPFILPGMRRAKIRWFMEEYTKALARFPNAEHFSYIGHSNGTYLLAGALTHYRCCHFRNVVFAGSVVRSDFPWSFFIPTRIQRVLNYVASADWVVALFPRFLARFRQDVGGAGWDGFPEAASGRLPVKDTQFVIGAHSTALREQNWNDIAQFILSDALPTHTNLTNKHQWFVLMLATIAPLVWIALLGVIVLPVLWFFSGAVPWHFAAFRPPGFVRWSLAGPVLFGVLWLMLMRMILTRL